VRAATILVGRSGAVDVIGDSVERRVGVQEDNPIRRCSTGQCHALVVVPSYIDREDVAMFES
jgi:hypothetical protein